MVQGTQPIFKYPYRNAAVEETKLRKQIDDLLVKGFINKVSRLGRSYDICKEEGMNEKALCGLQKT